jgi:Na+-transporting NADH:ubiquinone oxidoreductase subunit C
MKEKAFIMLFMVIIAAAFTAAVSTVHFVTRERVELNQKLKRRRFVLHVLKVEVPATASLKEIDRLYQERVRETGLYMDAGSKERPILEGLSETGEPAAYVIETSGRGFWDLVRGYAAINVDLRTIRGIAFFQQNETPGLGAEIGKAWFTQQFDGKAIPAEPDAEGLFIRLRPPGSELGPHDVDAITGATGTSTAVEAFLNRDIGRLLEIMKTQQ